MRKTTLAFVLSGLPLFAVSANAAGQKGGICVGMDDVDASSFFACEHLGKVTVKQIYENGFKVIAYHYNPRMPGVVNLIIEEQSKNGQPQS